VDFFKVVAVWNAFTKIGVEVLHWSGWVKKSSKEAF